MKSFFIKNKIFLKYFFTILSLILIDQISKKIAIFGFEKLCNGDIFGCSKSIFSLFNFTFVCNHGISFGIFDGALRANLFLFFSSSLIIGLFIYFLTKAKKKIEILSFLFIIGGAFGNIIDRITNGCVIDFLHFHYQDYHFPVFNLADSFVTIGGFLIFLNEVISFYHSKIKK